MSTYKRLLIALTLLILTGILFGSLWDRMQPIISCDPSPPNIYLSCEGLDQEIVPDELTVYEEMAAQFGSDVSRELVQERQVERAIQNLNRAAPACQVDVEPARELLEGAIRAWVADQSNRLDFFRGRVVFTPYSLESAGEMQKERDDLLTCYYRDMQRAGDWMVISSAVRPYCRYYDCFEWTVSPFPFLSYLVTHAGPAALPYLAGLLLTGIALVYFSSRLIRKHPDLATWILLLLAATELFFILRPAGLSSFIVGWILLCYGLALGYKWIIGV